MRARELLVTLAALLALAACSSPEARRTRGGGPGADVGNRGEQIEIHGVLNPFHNTPLRSPGR
jgi:hypothetical protein